MKGEISQAVKDTGSSNERKRMCKIPERCQEA